MLLKYQVKKIWNDPIKNFICFLVLFFPCLEIIYNLFDLISREAHVLRPEFMCFLVGSSTRLSHVFQSIVLWFFPLYSLLLTAEDCIEERKTGIRNIVIAKEGKKKYIKSHLYKSFIFSFLLIMLMLLINMALVYIIFAGGKTPKYDDLMLSLRTDNLLWACKNGLLVDFIYIIITAAICGLISMVGTISAIMLVDRKIVYGITMLFWFAPTFLSKSLLYVFQPFTEYSLSFVAPTIIGVFVVYILYISGWYVKEVYFDKKSI